MNISYNRFHIITLFLSTLLFTPLYSDYHTAHMTLHFEHQGSTKDLKEPRSHHDYSHNNTWTTLNLAHHTAINLISKAIMLKNFNNILLHVDTQKTKY